VIDGTSVEHILNKAEFSNFVRDIQAGDYIDTKELKSFRPGAVFNADYVPVLENKKFYGMANAKEFSFWLYEHYIAGFELHLSTETEQTRQDKGYL